MTLQGQIQEFDRVGRDDSTDLSREGDERRDLLPVPALTAKNDMPFQDSKAVYYRSAFRGRSLSRSFSDR